MFRISRHSPYPPSIDLATVRETLCYMRDDARAVAGLEGVAAALDAALREVDAAERTLKPVALSPFASRFLPARWSGATS